VAIEWVLLISLNQVAKVVPSVGHPIPGDLWAFGCASVPNPRLLPHSNATLIFSVSPRLYTGGLLTKYSSFMSNFFLLRSNPNCCSFVTCRTPDKYLNETNYTNMTSNVPL
jgi:hypothetical protein